MLRILTPWDSQPQEVAELAGDFRWDLLVNQATSNVNLALGAVFAAKGTLKIGVAGRYLDTIGANNLVQISAPLPGSAGYTALWVGAFTQANQSTRSVLRTTGGGFRLEPYTTGGGQYVTVTHTGVAQLNSPAPYTTGFNDSPVIVLVNYDGTTASIEVMHYADGYSITNTTIGWAAASGTIDLSTTSGGLGSYLIGYAASPMPAAMRRSLLGNLYGQLFAPRSIWVPVSVGGGSVSGTSATTNANDTSAASGTTTVVGTSATTNAADTSAASGSVGGAVTGTSATTNANDAGAASGTTTVTGTVAYSNANDTSTANGWAGSVSGTAAVTNADDTSSAAGSAGTVQTFFGGGYPMPRRRTKKELDDERRRLGILPPEVVEEVAAAPVARRRITLQDLIGKKAAAEITNVDLSQAIAASKKRKRQKDDELLLLM